MPTRRAHVPTMAPSLIYILAVVAENIPSCLPCRHNSNNNLHYHRPYHLLLITTVDTVFVTTATADVTVSNLRHRLPVAVVAAVATAAVAAPSHNATSSS